MHTFFPIVITVITIITGYLKEKTKSSTINS